eukprot:gnl/TRDRNA2_/TRDRNA2_186305_c0_seq1.p1 gnl/TRDRNA2_/TRDRNA2_186305_c0~~gnl/TRDRNA2_/TRDRNA2_186305_c0_seq1.p1  ORF type:complete len:280 (+),score=38.26 gnl/TRDRNA2_/TRDRNA2_186305_c0_seq1:142-981(+)
MERRLRGEPPPRDVLGGLNIDNVATAVPYEWLQPCETLQQQADRDGRRIRPGRFDTATAQHLLKLGHGPGPLRREETSAPRQQVQQQSRRSRLAPLPTDNRKSLGRHTIPYKRPTGDIWGVAMPQPQWTPISAEEHLFHQHTATAVRAKKASAMRRIIPKGLGARSTSCPGPIQSSTLHPLEFEVSQWDSVSQVSGPPSERSDRDVQRGGGGGARYYQVPPPRCPLRWNDAASAETATESSAYVPTEVRVDLDAIADRRKRNHHHGGFHGSWCTGRLIG